MKIDPLFCFSPQNLLHEPSGDRYYIAYSYKQNKKFIFNYLIADPYIKSGQIDCKFAANTEEIADLTSLYCRYYSFIEDFQPHERTNDLEFILKENPTLESLHKRFVDFTVERGEIFTKEFLIDNKDKLVLPEISKPKSLKTKILSKFKKSKKILDEK